ncbi:MAG: hypothetical protein COW18_01850 [Zetaproteobacteria bacterium CG12_big_fil_rev_8_21_14_0_65_54_13]|nr:MAG: hypothetical protein COW18_01850 [Zetaproteobacteria bacterium CG12_big_fil_rev_8_21_14_0_65_54_13]PIX55034.1 MAG: hypothetical protein COZ50_05080 [Zetaproteobacteria bacterium CG_4_10_14_3_um_filter_54_28]PJA28987.1 MAG: hypothetical protein CO188_07855 [Zetaproteobacteria bacterium CG_4_9_14_3_um_filter_54_145]
MCNKTVQTDAACHDQPGQRWARPVLRFTALFLFCVLLALLIQLAWRSAQAFELHHRAYVSLQGWLSGHQTPTPDRWQRNKIHLLTAINYQPANATFINTLGRLYLYRGLSLEKAPQTQVLNILKAKRAFKRAILLRPAWVYPWLNLAVADAALKLVDAEFIHAYWMAFRLGRWEENTMPQLIELGIVHFHRFSLQEQLRFKSYMVSALRNRSDHLQPLRHDRRLLNMACKVIDGDAAGREFCQ